MIVKSITLLTRESGADVLSLELDIPDGCYPYDGNAYAEIKVAKGKGLEYCLRHLHREPDKVIDSDAGIKSRKPFQEK